MTSGSILPSIGPSPPEFRRPQVPENLRPKLANGTAEQPPRQNSGVRPKSINSAKPAETAAADALLQLSGQREKTSSRDGITIVSGASKPPPVANLGGSSAVAVQVQEGESTTTSVSDQTLQGELTDEEKAAVQRLRERDREVRAHENAHASIGGGFAGSPSFEFSRGPDGVQYAVGGHVDIDVGEVPNDPQATIAKMEVVRSAALAPARPSGQDKAVAAAASAKAQEAAAELAAQKREELESGREDSDTFSLDGSISTISPSNENGESDSAFVSEFDQQFGATFGANLTGPTNGSGGQPQTISVDLLV